MTPQEYRQEQKAKLLACYNIEKSIEVEKPIEIKNETPQVIDVELITDQERLSEIKEQTFIEKAFDVINKSLEVFEKGGEGSRGGKVIGHTKSGKPIYANSKHESHKDFTEQDHEDAREVHMNETVTNRNMNERDEAAADHGREIGKKKGDYEKKSRK